MATIIDPRVIKELSSLTEGINPFPNGFNFDTCRGFKKDFKSRCGISPCTAQERKQFAELLSEFRVMKKCVDTNSLYVKMESFIALTHCKRVHRNDALKAFDEWKTQRKADASSSPPRTPSRSAATHADSLESLSDISSMTPPSSAADSLGYDEPTLDSYITEKMKSLEIDTATQNTQAKTDYSCFDEVEAQREKLKRLGVVCLPERGREQDNIRIYKAIQNPPNPKRMSGGIIYILEHTKISVKQLLWN
ncbi:hypothetical protein TARUN_4535 [Trichoderma arundinaceum]|uniref:Uncharacterized protein n=1 Tax=Trichoderma arundinaceum TaxID=490622 RepID=A0A395NP38_TRIAR|nr:hypothetical protein TARUN_4535 [Trichoderma arundinaceum]